MSLRISAVIGVIVIALAGAFIIFGPKKNNEQAQPVNERPVVAGTMFPVYDIARTVAGPDADVKLILPVGTSPHTFDVSPRAAAEFASVDRIFAIGHGVDNWASEIAAGTGHATIVTLDKDIQLREFAIQEHQEEEEVGEEEDEHGHEGGGIDPHYWLDPDNAIIMARTIAETLSELDPDHAAEYQERATTFQRELSSVDKDLQAKLKKFTHRNIATFHDVLGYFAAHYDLNIIATFEPFPGKEPTPQYLAHLQEEIKEHNVTVLFLEPQLSSRGIEAFAKDANVTLGMVDEMGGVDERETYIELLRYNVDAVDQALMLIHK